MAAPNEKLAESLDVLKALQEGGHRVFRSDDFSRVHRERLVENGFLQDVMKGWLISSSPGARQGDSSPWYASFWEFCARYCRERFGDEWYLSPEQFRLPLRNSEGPKSLQSPDCHCRSYNPGMIYYKQQIVSRTECLKQPGIL